MVKDQIEKHDDSHKNATEKITQSPLDTLVTMQDIEKPKPVIRLDNLETEDEKKESRPRG